MHRVLMIVLLMMSYCHLFAQDRRHNILYYFPDTLFAQNVAARLSKTVDSKVTLGELQRIDSLSCSPMEELKNLQGIKYLTGLLYFDCCKNGVTELPAEIGQLKKLRVLNLNKAFELKIIPKEIGQLDHLEELWMALTSVKTIPTEIGKLHKLKILMLGANDLKHIPNTICNLSNLERLILTGDKIGSLPNELGRLKKLTELDVSYCGLTSIPKSIGKLTRLENLNLFSNDIRKLPVTISHLVSIKKMDIYDNNHLDESYLFHLPPKLKRKPIRTWSRP